MASKIQGVTCRVGLGPIVCHTGLLCCRYCSATSVDTVVQYRARCQTLPPTQTSGLYNFLLYSTPGHSLLGCTFPMCWRGESVVWGEVRVLLPFCDLAGLFVS